MATTQKVKLANGTIVTQEIDPDYNIEFNVPTEFTPLNLTIVGPEASTTVKTIGGRNRRD